jgi:formyl-CoA transferase
MSSSAAKSKSSKVTTKATLGRLFVLDLSDGRVLSCKPDGSDLKTIVSEGRRLPDGIVVDAEAGHIYWTNMGNLKANDGWTAVCIYAAIVTALYRRERSGEGSYVTTSLLAAGIWSASVFIQAALCGANFYGLHDRAHPANAALNVYRSSDGTWFVLVVTPDKVSAVLKALGREDILTDPRFSNPAQLEQNRPQLTAMLDEIFGSQPMSHWYEVLNGVHVTFGAVCEPQEVVNDPQLRANEIIVPLEGAGEKLTSTISSPIQVHGVTKLPARRAPRIGEHNDEVLKELGFTKSDIEGPRASGTIPPLQNASSAAD